MRPASRQLVSPLLAALALVACIGVGAWSQDRAADSGKAAESGKTTGNAYLPRKGLSTDDLRAYIERMQQAPESIRNRSGHAEGIVVAAERILETNPKGTLRTFAVLSLLDALHHWADSEGSEDADKRLAELSTKYADDEDKKIASTAQLYALEQRVLKADDLDAAALSKLLDEVKTALDGRQLDARHLRLASATVGAINKIKDDEEATRRLKEFGQLFAASNEPELARYGRKLVATAAPDEPRGEWIGKPMQLAGTTADGAKFDIAQYKGKVVLVDFWATWCPPCRAAMPDLKQAYEKYRKQGFEIVGVALDDDLTALAAVIDQEKIPWVNVIGEQQGTEMKFPLAEKYGIEAIPTVFLVGKDGKIVAQTHQAEELMKQVEKLLAEKPAAK